LLINKGRNYNDEKQRSIDATEDGLFSLSQYQEAWSDKAKQSLSTVFCSTLGQAKT